MLVAALRSDNPLGGASLTCDEAAESFTMQGVGEITAAKLLDLENRRQLVWADPVTRDWVLETIALRVRRTAAAKAAARAAPPLPSASAAQEQARAGGVVREGAVTLVFEPPRPVAARQPAGVRAAQTRFEAPAATTEAPRRVVWSEPPDVASASQTTGAASQNADPAAAPHGAVVPGAVGPGGVAMTTRRVDRRRSLKQAERRHALVPARLARTSAVVVIALLAVLVVVVLFVVAHGGF